MNGLVEGGRMLVPVPALRLRFDRRFLVGRRGWGGVGGRDPREEGRSQAAAMVQQWVQEGCQHSGDSNKHIIGVVLQEETKAATVSATAKQAKTKRQSGYAWYLHVQT